MKYQFSETVVAKVTGLARDALRQQRKDELEPGKDWGLVDGEVCYAPSGVRILCEKMGLPSADVQKKCRLEAHTPVPDSPEPAVASTDIRVERVCPNPTWVMGRVAGNLVKVRVKNNAGMERGTLLRACEDVVDHWEYHGRCWR
jgi:hypothetical protein